MTIRDFLSYLSQHSQATALLDFSCFPNSDPTTQPMSDYKPELRPRSRKPWTLRHDALHMKGTKGGHQNVRGIIVGVDGRGDILEDPLWLKAFGLTFTQFRDMAKKHFALLPGTVARFEVNIQFEEKEEDPYTTVDRVLQFLDQVTQPQNPTSSDFQGGAF